MSLNRNDIMCKLLISFIIIKLVDKSKLMIIKADKLFVVIPLTVTKVETKLRNVFINE